MQRRRFISACLRAVAALTAAIAINGFFPAQAENSAISMRRAAERTSFSNEEIRDGLLKTAFRAELQFGRHEERIRKFDEAVHVFVDNHGAPARTADIAAIVNDIRARVHHLDLAVTADRKNANVVVILVPRRDFARTIRSRYGESAASKIQNSLHPGAPSDPARRRR
jgi:aspartate aminotransferase-like enzyme